MKMPAAVGYFASAEDRDRYLACYEESRRLSPAPVEIRDVATRFGTVRVYRHGPEEGSPIVLVHAFLATSASWAANVTALAEHHPVYTLDALGQSGLSVQTVPIRNAADSAAWLAEVLGGLGLRRVHLVGWSYGGWMSFQQALLDPGRVASLTLVDPANTLARFSVRFLARLFALPVAAMVPAFDWMIDRNTEWMIGDPDPQDPALGALRPLVQLLQAGSRAYRIRGVPYPSYPGDAKLRSVRAPVLALLAGRSVVHDSSAAVRRVRALLPDARPELWPTATHALPAEFPDEVNERILGFVAQHS